MTAQLSTDIRMQQLQVLAPQLQQSLKMLQLPTMDVQALLAHQLSTNPTLEQYDPIRDVGADEDLLSFDPDQQDTSYAEEKRRETVSRERTELAAENDYEQRGEHLLAQDDSIIVNDEDIPAPHASDVFESHGYQYESVTYRERSGQEDEEYTYRMQAIPADESLADELRMQFHAMVDSQDDYDIFEYILGSLDASGFLTETPEQIADTCSIPIERVQSIISLFQSFDPPGIAAPDLRSSLLIQLQRKGNTDSRAYRIIEEFYPELLTHKLEKIARALNISHAELQDAITEIGTLDPRPGRDLTTGTRQTITPDVIVTRQPNGEYSVETNDSLLPYVRVSPRIRQMMKDGQMKAAEKKYMRTQVQEGETLVHNLEFRKRTILAVAEAIVEEQKAFLDDGPLHLKPLGMKEVAEKVGVHEATVSRTVNGKYMDTPQGVYEMRYFFSTHLSDDEGHDVSSNAAKAKLKKLIESEDSHKPYSDDALAKLMTKDGFPVARRTVVKYRKALGIPNMRYRKEFV